MRVVIFYVLILLFFINSNIYSDNWKKIKSNCNNNSINRPIININNFADSIIVNYKISNEMISIISGLNQDIDNKKTQKVQLNGCENFEYEGEPILPFIALKLILPQKKKLKGISTLFNEDEKIGQNVIVEYGEKIINPSFKQKNDVTFNKDIYEKNNLYPLNNYELVSIQKKCGVTIAYINLFPIKYLPQDKVLNIYKSLRVKIGLLDKEYRNSDIKVHLSNISEKNLDVENLTELLNYRSYSVKRMSSSIASKRENCDYLIITNEELKNATTDWSLSDLIIKRESQGLKTKIVTVEEIYMNYSGIDKPEKIRNFIKDAYNTWGIKYLFLAGDSNIIPARILTPDRWPLGGAKEAYIPSDIYYQCLDGNYNVNNDAWWGEKKDGENWNWIDLSAEICIGRAPAENALEMSNFIYKTISYENSVSNEKYLKNALFLGEYMGFYQDSEYAKQHMEEIRNGSNLHNYVTKGFISDPSIKNTTLYEKDYSWGRNEITQKINSNEYGIIEHLGHGMPTEVMHLKNNDADKLNNEKFPFIYTQACYCGRFTQDCVAEHLVTSNRNGAWGGVFNGETGRINATKTSGPSQRMNRWFWDAYFSKGITKVGEMNQYSHEKCIDLSIVKLPDVLHCIYVTNLWADPYSPLKFKNENNSIVFTSPIIGDTILKGDSLNINWVGSNDPFKVELMKGAQVVYLISESSIKNRRWYVPLTLDTAKNYSIKITSNINNFQVFRSDTFTISSDLTNIISIKSNKKQKQFDVVPNPVSSMDKHIQILLPSQNVQINEILIFDALSNLIFKESFKHEVNNKFLWDLRNSYRKKVSAGSYKLIIKATNMKSGKKITYKKIIGIKK